MKLQIEPLSQKKIHYRQGGWVETKRVWLAVGGRLGKLRGRCGSGPQIYDVDCGYRFCIDSYLQDFQTACIVLGGSTETEARFKALAFTLSELQQRTGCDCDEYLVYWELTLVSSNPEFLVEIEAQISMAPDDRPYNYIGSCGGDPIKRISKFKRVNAVLISRPDAKIIKEAEDLKIDLN